VNVAFEDVTDVNNRDKGNVGGPAPKNVDKKIEATFVLGFVFPYHTLIVFVLVLIVDIIDAIFVS